MDMNKLGINMDMNKLDMNKFSIGVQRRIKEVQKNIKLMKKEALVESFDDLKLLLKCRITNEYYGCLAVDDKGKRYMLCDKRRTDKAGFQKRVNQSLLSFKLFKQYFGN